MPKQINSAGVGQRLVQLFSLKGRFQPVLDEVIVPVVNVDPEGVEMLPASAVATISAVAAEYSTAFLTNPTGSGKLLTVEAVMGFLGTDAWIWITQGTIAGTSAATSYWRDLRLTGSPTATWNYGTTAVSIATAAADAFFCGNNAADKQEQILRPRYIVPPGDSLEFQVGTVNIGATLGVRWWEQDIVTPGYR